MTSLDWPAEFRRTPPADRSPNRSFEVSLHDAVEDLAKEMGRLDVDDWRLSTAMDHQTRNPNYPYANQPEPDDPGVVLRWSMDGDQFAVACDWYNRVRDNLRSVGLYVAEKRKMGTRPVTTGETEFANARLPPGDDEESAVPVTPSPHSVLGVDRGADDEEVNAAARELLKEHHPDHGGERQAFMRVKWAREVILSE
ncbi:J domain-containing protein [Halorarum salinum]|uniref:DnaJ domain-containing protein n=1 Tax=Halorarum salinum TaxID=2743089 RepID=A0A7D5QBY1_9EURY|nr:J domain-containing protein [Halobaculum salinum]QLG62220.1 DnaJ domain-containing protein [Halobaculum salinum]